MSVAIHLFVVEKFSEKSYQAFLRDAQSLFGKWKLVETVAFNNDPNCQTIHECWVYSQGVPEKDWFRINIQADKYQKDEMSPPFEYEWQLSIETSVGRSPLGLAVQFGTWLQAMYRFRFTHALDHDTCLTNEPTEFPSIQAAAEHARRLFAEYFNLSADLKQRQILDENGFFLLPTCS